MEGGEVERIMSPLIILLAARLCVPETALAADRRPMPQAYQYRETRDLVRLVQGGAGLIAKQGEAAFAQFSRPGSRWRHDDIYMVVYDTGMVRAVYPPSPDKVGEATLGMSDPSGKPIFRWLLETASLKGNPGGWIHYRWLRPGDSAPSWKSAYVMMAKDPSGKEHVVSSGLYKTRMEKSFVSNTVEEAAGLVARLGDQALPAFKDPEDRFLYRDVYVIVYSEDGVKLVDASDPATEGQNRLGLKDANGKLLVREMIELAKTKGSGWVRYHWPKPGETKPALKMTYVKRVVSGPKAYVVCAGLYLEP